MGKFSELDRELKDIRYAVSSILASVDVIEKMLSCTKEEPVQPKEATPTYEEVRAFLAEKSRKGHTAAIKAFLEKYGATKLSDVSAKDYNALLADAATLIDPEDDEDAD